MQFYAFDILVSDGEDLRRLPLSMRKTNLARLLARRVDGIFLSDFEQGEIGPDLFRHACLMGLEGMVSKHRESTYRGGRSRSLDQGQEPAASGVQPGAGSVRLRREPGTMSIVLRKFGGGASDIRVARSRLETGNHKAGGLPSSVPETSCPQPVHSPPNRVCRQPALRMRRRRKSASSPRSYSQGGWITARSLVARAPAASGQCGCRIAPLALIQL